MGGSGGQQVKGDQLGARERNSGIREGIEGREIREEGEPVDENDGKLLERGRKAGGAT